MDVKELQNEANIGERNNDGSKYASSGVTLPYSRNKPYQDVSSVSLGKVDAQTSRPCAVIGPDRVLPQPVPNDSLKKSAYEAWYADSVYRHPPEYPHKMTNYHTPIRNISPRQTFQENMQRIMVPPSYNSLKGNEEHHFSMDKNVSLPKSTKPNIPLETKYCEVPYSGSFASNEQKSVRNTEQCATNVNPVLARSVPQGWPPHVRPTRPYGASELYQYPEYTNCAGPRSVPMTTPHRTTHEDPKHGYPDPYYHDGNIRFKPYTTVKDRYPQARYEFISNYPSPFHPPSAFPPHKYDTPKTIPQPYSYPQVPLKYLDSRIPDPLIEGYQRPAQQNNYNLPFHNQMIHPAYGPVLGNCIQNKFPCPPDGSVKSVAPNKPPYDTNKMYAEYENTRTKGYPVPETYYFNEMQRPPHHIKSQVMPNFPVNIHGIPPHAYYRKDSSTIKNYEYMSHFRNIDPSLFSQSRMPSQFSPNAITISPPDANHTLEPTQIQGGTQEDYGYVSQSPTAGVRSVDYVNRSANEFYRRYDSRYGPTIRPPPMMAKPEPNPNANSKDKKDIDVRQFLQMWNEVDDENAENANKEAVAQLLPNDVNKATTPYETVKNQDQLYVLGLVNVPSEELGKYEHIQKVSKLPENIKGYNSIELLNQFEEVIESSNVNSLKTKASNSRDMNFQMSMKNPASHHSVGLLPRPVSPLDVEAKISQSVIHKEVGCNFEIKPCSPKMLNVEAATPIQNLLSERAIEKVSNPLIVSPPILHKEDTINCTMLSRQDHIKSPNETVKNTSCKMTNTQFNNNDSGRPNYSIQDFESNSGVCLASLPRLDNDIELNFPEVNQQFINANKGETVITATKDLPSLINVDHTENEGSKTGSNLREVPEANYEFPSILDSEREFSKLSKYRKIKKSGSESLEKETPSFSSTRNMRTDSVIIKNPENLKIYEQNKETPLADSLAFMQEKNILSKDNFVDELETDKEFSSKVDNCAADTPMDIAIDFSLNKNDCNNSASNYYVGNRFKPSKNDRIKHRSKMSKTGRSNLLEDQKQHEILSHQQEPQQIEDENLIIQKADNESKQVQKIHECYEVKPEKSTIIVNQHYDQQSKCFMYKKCDEINEETDCKLKPQLSNDCTITEEVNKYVKEKSCDNNNFEYSKKTHKIDVNNDSNMCTRNEVNEHFDTSHLKEDSSSVVTSHINDDVLNKYRRGSFELFSDESDGYATDSSSNDANKVQKKSTTAEFKDSKEINNTENSDAKDEINIEEEKIDTMDENHKTNIKEHISVIDDKIKVTSKKINTDEMIQELGAVQRKSDITYAIETNKEVDTVAETDKVVKNINVEHDMYLREKQLDVDKDTTDPIREEENSDVTKDLNQGEEISCEKDVYKTNEIRQNADNEDVNETENGNDIFVIADENINEAVKIPTEEKSADINNDTSLIKVKFTNVLLENNIPGNSLYDCETITNDIDKIQKESDTCEILNDIDTVEKSIETCNLKKLSAIESATNDNFSNTCQTIENNTIFTEIEENLFDSKNKQVGNVSTTLIRDDLLKECETFKNTTNETQMEVNTKHETEEDMSSLLLGCANPIKALNSCDENSCMEDLLMQSDPKQKYGTELTFGKLNVNKHDTNEQLHGFVDETTDNNISFKDTELLQATSTKIDAWIENEQDISLNANEGSNQSQLLVRASNSTSNENANQLLPLPFSNSLISPLSSDDESSNSPHSNPDMFHEEENLDFDDCNCYSPAKNSSNDQNIIESNVPSLENDQISSNVLIVTYTTPKDINREEPMHGKNMFDLKRKSGFKKELFSPFIQKLISHCDYSNNVQANAIRNYPSPRRICNDVVEHIKLADHADDDKDVHISNENTSKNVKIKLNDAISTSVNKSVEDITTNSAMGDANNSQMDISISSPSVEDITTNSAMGDANNSQMDISISSPVQDIEDSISCINSHLCSTVSPNEDLNIHSDDHYEKCTSEKTTITNDSILAENSEHAVVHVLSPKYLLKSNVDVENNENFETSDTSYVQQLNANITKTSAMKEVQINDKLTPNDDINIEGALNVEPSQDLSKNKYNVSSNRSCLKRSLSDSALDSFNDRDDAFYSGWQPKRSKKMNIVEPDIIFESNGQNHRRKSISSIYNEPNLSFCILIDNDCIITEEEESEEQNELCYTEISESCITDSQEPLNEYNNVVSPNIVGCPEEINTEYSVTQDTEDKSFEESWVDDVGCIETIVSDVAEDITISASSSPERILSPENEESGIFMNSDHTEKVKHIYGDKMCNDDIMFLETLYRTPQMNVNKVIKRESQISDECIQYYNKDSLEKVLSGCKSHEDLRSDLELLSSDANNSLNSMHSTQDTNIQLKEQFDTRSISPSEEYFSMCDTNENDENGNEESLATPPGKTQDDTVHSCESSIDNVFSYNQRDDYTTYTSSTSPEVSSTTSEERNSAILLKITNYKGSRISQINDFEQEPKSISCKFTELNDYSSSQNFKSNKTLITKAAQKYIPPLKESFGDLKIRLPLPQHSLLRLKQLKVLKEELKLNKCNVKPKPDIPKKTKPKFEDVLKSIDEIQFKKHKEKSKKAKKSIPKVVIKKTENGSHYASTPNREPFNPDLTGRKWQPWVFLEKNSFIDKMALRNKRKAIFNYRKNTYVLAEKFRKYKSIGNAKFIISQPNLHNSSIGHLKCTIRLKHTY